jgi:signal peptidase I
MQAKPLFFVAGGAAAAFLVKLFDFDLLVIAGPSMLPGLAEGRTLPVLRCAYGLPVPFGATLLVRWGSPAPGDVVLYRLQGRTVVKRCVAVGGDALAFFAPSPYTGSYLCVVNGREIPLTEPQYQRLKHSPRVPAGTIFAVGDNPPSSLDSRDYGFVNADDILGRGLCR